MDAGDYLEGNIYYPPKASEPTKFMVPLAMMFHRKSRLSHGQP